ncbi:MAG: RluA family pseudouridine synthase [Oscillospiraceae bacterium]|nr:RluA family pseudouridine synthase [Oscillospiraceae bacterium]
MRELAVNKNDSGQRLDKFIQKTFPSMPVSVMYKAIRTKHIKLNKKRCQIGDKLAEGDKIELWLGDDLLLEKEFEYEFMKASSQLQIAYEDENILVADKPQGLIVHQDESYQSDTLIARIQRYLFEKNEYSPKEENSFAPALVNRIDRNTGGLVIAAKTASALRILNRKMKDREISKKYLCVVHGVPKRREMTLTGYLDKDEGKNRVFVHSSPKAGLKTIKTRYRVLTSVGDKSLLEIDLLTGRTHQIRAHLASIGHPLAGDGKYGTNAQNKGAGYSKQALYSYKLRFDFTTDAGELNYLSGVEVMAKNVAFLKDFGYMI